MVSHAMFFARYDDKGHFLACTYQTFLFEIPRASLSKKGDPFYTDFLNAKFSTIPEYLPMILFC